MADLGWEIATASFDPYFVQHNAEDDTDSWEYPELVVTAPTGKVVMIGGGTMFGGIYGSPDLSDPTRWNVTSDRPGARMPTGLVPPRYEGFWAICVNATV